MSEPITDTVVAYRYPYAHGNQIPDLPKPPTTIVYIWNAKTRAYEVMHIGRDEPEKKKQALLREAEKREYLRLFQQWGGPRKAYDSWIRQHHSKKVVKVYEAALKEWERMQGEQTIDDAKPRPNRP